MWTFLRCLCLVISLSLACVDGFSLSLSNISLSLACVDVFSLSLSSYIVESYVCGCFLIVSV